MANIPVSIIVTARDEASRVLNRMGTNIARAGEGLRDFHRNAMVASAGILAVGAGAYKLASDAAKFESVSDAFRGMTKGMINSQEEFVQKVKAASANTLSSMDVVQGATRALALIGKKSFTNFGDDFAKMAELSKKAARATGQDVNFMFNSLILGVSRSSKLILDNLGITMDMAEAQARYKEEIMKTTGATEIEAEKASLLRATIEKLDETYKNVSVTSGGLAGAQQTLRATLEDVRTEIGTALMPVFNDFIRTLLPLIQEYAPQLASILGEITSGFAGLPKPIQAVIVGLLALLPLVSALGLLLIPLKAGLSALASVIGLALSPVLLSLAAGVVAFIPIVVQATKSSKWWWEQLKALWRGLKDNFALIKEIIGPIKVFDKAIIIIKDNIRFLRDNLLALRDSLKEVASWFGNVTGKIGGAINKISEWIGKRTEAISRGLHFQTGGVVPGPIGKPQMAVVHGGERILPTGVAKAEAVTGGGGITITIQAGFLLATRTEVRKFGMMIWDELANYARAQSKTPEELLNLAP